MIILFKINLILYQVKCITGETLLKPEKDQLLQIYKCTFLL